jgi:hypothetical protein
MDLIDQWLNNNVLDDDAQHVINVALLCVQTCRNPTLRQVWGGDSHSQKWELGVPRDSRNFRARQ